MKKFMFSAVALVAFSFAGMANNAVEETKKEVEIEVVRTDCYEYATNSSLAEIEALGQVGYDEMMDMYDFYLGFCRDLGGNVGEMVVVTN